MENQIENGKEHGKRNGNGGGGGTVVSWKEYSLLVQLMGVFHESGIMWETPFRAAGASVTALRCLRFRRKSPLSEQKVYDKGLVIGKRV